MASLPSYNPQLAKWSINDVGIASPLPYPLTGHPCLADDVDPVLLLVIC